MAERDGLCPPIRRAHIGTGRAPDAQPAVADTGISGSERTYDFGPGGGLVAAATLHVHGTPVLSARWHGAYIHSVSGSPADHYTEFAGVEGVVPVTHVFGVGAYAGWYQRRSSYRGRLGEATRFPEARVYLTWQPNRFPSLRETP